MRPDNSTSLYVPSEDDVSMRIASGERKFANVAESVPRCMYERHGYERARMEATKVALDEAYAYHALTVKEAPRDRAWAEKLAESYKEIT